MSIIKSNPDHLYRTKFDIYRKQRYISKKTTKTTIFDQIPPIFNIIELFRYKIEFRIEIRHKF